MKDTTQRTPRTASAALILLATLAPTALAQNQPSPIKQAQADLRAKDIHVTLEAIDKLGTLDDRNAERTLSSLLRDKDWEVQERAAMALGAKKAASALKKLVDLAVDGDIARIRQAAALAVGAINPVEGAERIFKKAKGDRQTRAYDALGLVLRGQSAWEDIDDVFKHIKGQDAGLREAAARAWLEGTADREDALRQLTQSNYLGVRCLALDAVAEAPRKEDHGVLQALFTGERQNDVIERRILRAMASVLAIADAEPKTFALATLVRAGDDGLTLLRRARLVPMLCRGDKPVFDAETAVDALQPCFAAKGEGARSAACKALREIGGDAALKRALRHFDGETSPRAQLQLVETVSSLRAPAGNENLAGNDKAVAWLVEIAAGNYEQDVRERAIVRLGKTGVKGAAKTLIQALRDSRWELACCAAVSLGKTDDDAAFEPLNNLLKNSDWRLRGAAVVGLMHWSRDAAVDPLLGMLDDKSAIVARAAHEALRTMSRNYEAKPDAKAWRKWWTDNRKNHDYTDREATLNKLDKYGYAVPDSEIYNGLDVLVFTSRGDHIEQLLERLEIYFRTTSASHVTEDGVHPEAIFVSNCTGELAPNDVMPLRWFVKTGGSLFGSCWALTHTIAAIHPDVVAMAQTVQQVLDDVRALPCRADSPLLNGVFPRGVVPIYHLEGAHLIQVLDPERCEVLIDSPDAAERHGCGNLAAWFFSGHGLLFDSANHFDLQGLGVAGAGALKKPKERQAYAVDHLGMTMQTWRACRSEGYWKSPTKANRSVPDLSAFRLLTNFVRSKRTGKY